MGLGRNGLGKLLTNVYLPASSRADKGFTVAAYNRTTSKVDHFLENEAKGKSIVGAHSIEELCKQLKTPRKIILLVKAGDAVDSFIEQLEPFLEKGDIIIDGGNSHFPDSIRRTAALEAKGLLFVGSGVSGGEEGARYGPSISALILGLGWLRVGEDAHTPPRLQCPVDPPPRGLTSRRSSKRLPLRSMDSRAATGLESRALDTCVVFFISSGDVRRGLPLTFSTTTVRQDGPQRNRIRRHAAHHRGVRYPQARLWHVRG